MIGFTPTRRGWEQRPLVTLLEDFKRWYEGEYVPPDNSPSSGVVFLLGHYQRHWSSRLAHVLVAFYLKEWRWLLVFLVGVIALIVKLT